MVENNIYLIAMKECSYDEFNAFVVIAKDEELAMKLCDINETCKHTNLTYNNIESIELIGTTNLSCGEVLSSFNAG